MPAIKADFFFFLLSLLSELCIKFRVLQTLHLKMQLIMFEKVNTAKCPLVERTVKAMSEDWTWNWSEKLCFL